MTHLVTFYYLFRVSNTGMFDIIFLSWKELPTWLRVGFCLQLFGCMVLFTYVFVFPQEVTRFVQATTEGITEARRLIVFLMSIQYCQMTDATRPSCSAFLRDVLREAHESFRGEPETRDGRDTIKSPLFALAIRKREL